MHGARTAADAALAVEAQGLPEAIRGSHRHVFYSATGRRMTLAALARLGIPRDATAYLCGPPGFLTDVESALRGLGLTNVRSELFGGRAAIHPVSSANTRGCRTRLPARPVTGRR